MHSAVIRIGLEPVSSRFALITFAHYQTCLWFEMAHLNGLCTLVRDQNKKEQLYPSLPPPLKATMKAQRHHFGIIEMGGGVVQMFHLFCRPKIVGEDSEWQRYTSTDRLGRDDSCTNLISWTLDSGQQCDDADPYV